MKYGTSRLLRGVLTRLETQAAVLQALIETVPVGIIIAEAPSGRVLGKNQRIATLMGEAPPRGFHADGRLMEPHEYPLARAVCGHVTNGLVCQIGRDDGSLVWVRVDGAPIRDAGGCVIGGIIAATSMEDERSTQARLEEIVDARTTALARSTARNQALFDHSPFDIMVLQVAADGTVLIEEANAAYCRTTGLRAEALLMRPIEVALNAGTAEMLARDCRTALQHGGFECQHTLSFPSGERLVRTYYRVLPDEVAPFRRVLLTQTDLTEVRKVEVALRQAMRLEAIGQLTGGVAHDFNNLLTAVLGNLELLAGKVTDESQQRWIRNSTLAAQRGAALTHQLLAYSRKQFLAPVPTDIPAAIGAMAELIRGSLGGRIQLVTDFLPQTWPAIADPAQLELALINLVVNARDAMKAGGVLAISTDNCPAGGRSLPAELDRRDYVRLCVSDTGAGMEPDVLSRAMEPFFTTKSIGEGSGLGLSQAYGYARQLGGTLRLNSRVGEGTVVEIYLPRAKPAARAAA